MDFSAFSHTSFDPVKWIDGMIAERPEEERQELDAFITSLTMKLHVVAQEYTDQLETGMIDAAAMMPRCLSEVSRTQGILKTLDSEMASLATQLQEFDQRNINGVEDLSRLDTLKLNMERCKATLEEHARWSQLVREATSLLDSGGRLSDSADRLEILSNSLEILHSMPGHDERIHTFKSLTERLMSALQPVVLQEIMGNDMTSLRESLYVYNKIKRSYEFIDIYTTNRPKKLEAVCNECFNGTAAASKTQIPQFYGHIYGFLADEAENIAILFGKDEVSNLLCILIEKIMTPLQAAMAQRYTASDYSTVEEFSKRIAPLVVNASDEYLLKGMSSVYACFLQNSNMLLNSEGKWIRVALQNTIASLKLGKSVDSAEVNTLSNTGIDFDDEDEVLDADEVTELFESYGRSLATSAAESSQSIQTSIVRSLSFLGGLHSRKFLRFLVPLVSQHLKAFTGKIEELRRAACLGDQSNTDCKDAPQSDTSSSTLNSDLKRYGLADLGTSKGRVLLPSALQVFRAASVMNHQFLILERAASEQLEKVYAQLFSSHTLKDVVAIIASRSSTDIKSGKGSYVKDADVSIGSSLAAVTLRQDSEVESELKAFLLASTRLTVSSVTQSVFSASLTSLIKFKVTAEQYLFDLTTCAVESYFKELHLDQVWESSPLGDNEMNDDPEAEEIDEDNLLPQHVFTQVGEHLLSLLQELETFASSNTIENLIRLSDDADSLVSKAWKPLRNVLELSDDESYRNLSKKSTCFISIAKAEQAMYGTSQSTEGIVELTVGDSEPTMLDTDDADDDDVLQFVNEWLGAISDYTVGVLLVEICQISKLSALGKAQLRVDLTYLNNVINALGLHRHPFLSHIILLLEQDMEKIPTQLEFIPMTPSPLAAISKYGTRIVTAASATSSDSKH